MPPVAPSVPPASSPSSAVLRRLLGGMRPYWRTFAAGVVAMIVYAATEAALPALLKQLLDGSFVAKNPAYVHLMPLALVGLFVVRGFTDYAHSVAMHSVANRVVLDLRQRLFERLLVLPSAWFHEQASAALITRFTYHANQVNPVITTSLVTLVRDSLTVAGLIGYMVWLDWKLSLVFFAVVPLIAWIIRGVSRRLRGFSRGMQSSMGGLSHVVDEAIAAHREIRVFGGQAHEAARFAAVNDAVRRFAMKTISTSSANGPIVQAVAVVALAAIVYYASLTQQLTVGGFVSFITAMGLLLTPLKRLSNVNEVLQRGLTAAGSLFELLDAPAEPDTGTRRIGGRASGHLRFEGVQFRYAGTERDALAGIDLDIRPGETVAIVGASGSGKSTLVSLIPRFHVAGAGRILLDGVDIRELALADLRAQIALVTQHVVLFDDTVAANIAYARSDVPEAEIVRAAEAAHAMEFIRALPQGLATPIGENGARLSGGQRQRLSIARALLKNAPILLLDEATSALDTESERAVQAALDNLRRGRTTLVIAHRLSTIAAADRIVVLEAGRISECGTHDELLARGGAYARLHAHPSALAAALE